MYITMTLSRHEDNIFFFPLLLLLLLLLLFTCGGKGNSGSMPSAQCNSQFALNEPTLKKGTK